MRKADLATEIYEKVGGPQPPSSKHPLFRKFRSPGLLSSSLSPSHPTGQNPFRDHQDTKAFARSQAEVCLAERRSFTILYSMLSANACQLASMMFSETPTVPHFSLWSPDSISTRTREAVPLLAAKTRTL